MPPRQRRSRRPVAPLKKVTFAEEPQVQIVPARNELQAESYPTDFTQTNSSDAVETAKALAAIWANEKTKYDPGARFRLSSEWIFDPSGEVEVVPADDETLPYDQPCSKGHNNPNACQAMSGHCRWSSWYFTGFGRCNMDLELIRRAFQTLRQRRKPDVLVPVRTLLWTASQMDDEMKIRAKQIILLFQEDMISYSDILACFYLVAPYIISRAENVNDIDTLINLMVAYCQMKAPFAQSSTWPMSFTRRK